MLGARVMADPERPPWLRAACAAATAPLGLGVVLTFSRGTLVALAVGLAALCLLAPTRAQLRAVALALAATVVAGAAGIALDGIRTLGGSSRELDGAAMLALLLVLMGGLAALAWREPPAGRLRHAWPAALAGAGAVVLVMVAIGLSGATPSTGTPAAGADPARFASTESNRYAYWRVALEAFADHPLEGVGSGGFRVEWRREREVRRPRARRALALPRDGRRARPRRAAAARRGDRRDRDGRAARRRRGSSPRCCCTPRTRASTGTGRCRRSRSWRC